MMRANPVAGKRPSDQTNLDVETVLAAPAQCVPAGQRGGGCEIRTREGLPPTRFPTMLNVVHDRPPPFATCTNTIRVTAGERSRTGVNESKTETTVVELQATGSCMRAELNRWPCSR